MQFSLNNPFSKKTRAVDERMSSIPDSSSSIRPLRQSAMRRRDLANLRERRRMMLINRGFEVLKNRLPIKDLLLASNILSSSSVSQGRSVNRSRHEKCQKHLRLTKGDILKLTIRYIRHLLSLLSRQEQVHIDDGHMKAVAKNVMDLCQVRNSTVSMSNNMHASLGREQGGLGPAIDRTISRQRLVPMSGHSQVMKKLAEKKFVKSGKRQIPDVPEVSEYQITSDWHKQVVSSGSNTKMVITRCSNYANYLLSWSRRGGESYYCEDEPVLLVSNYPVGEHTLKVTSTKLWIPGRF